MSDAPVSVTSQRDGDVYVVVVNNPPVNALSWHVRQGLADHFAAALADDGVKAIVLRCDGGTFIAGADITEFGKAPQGPDFNAVLNTIEAATKPVVAAIHGTALGGGLETALVCHYRVAVPSAKLGVPEVKLGLLPGAGGTQRLPRIVGVEMAAEMGTRDLFMKGLWTRIIMIGTLTGMQWYIYGSFKAAVGLGTS